MKRIIYLAFLLGLAQIDFAQTQNNKIDSLRHLLEISKQDSTRSLLLGQLGGEFKYSDPDTALLLSGMGLGISRQINFVRGEADCLSEIGEIFTLVGNNAKALELSLQALKKSETINDLELECNILIVISHVYYEQGDYKRELNYLLHAKDIAVVDNNERQLLISSNDVGDCYERLDQLDSARFYINKAYDLAIKQKDQDFIGTALNNLGNIYSKMQQPTIAMDNYRLSLPYSIEEKDYINICETTFGMAKLFQKMGRIDSCMHYSKISFIIAQKNGFTKWILDAGNFLAEYYKQHGIIDSAYKYLSSVMTAKDSLFSQKKTNEIQNLSFDETMRQQDIAANKVLAEHEHKNNLEIIGISAGLIILISLFFVLSHSVIIHERWIKFLGILGLLIVFEYFYILIDPYVVKITNESPIYMLLLLIGIAVILEPIHNRIEHWITYKVVAKNKQLRLEAAKKTVGRLESEANKNEN